MADWPIAGMSNQGYPELGYKVQRLGPKTLISRFEDGGVVAREKTATQYRRFIEKWNLDRTDMDAVLDFYESKGMATQFTRLDLDPISGASFLTDNSNVLFEKAPTIEQFGPLRYKVTLTFIEVST